MSRALAPLPRYPVSRRRDDQEFLPAALAILETPPSPIRIALIWTICLLVVLAAAWGYFGRIDIIAAAPGKIRPSGNVKIVEPLRSGRVIAIHARDGQSVKAGDVLVELDRRDAQADQRAGRAALASVEAEIARRGAEQTLVAARRLEATPSMNWPQDAPTNVRRREAAVLEAELAGLRSSIATLEAQAASKANEQMGLQATIAAETQLIQTDGERVQMKATLLQRSAGTRSELVNAMETLRYQQMMIAQFQGALAAARAQEKVIQRQIQETYDRFLTANAQKLEDAQRNRDDLRQRLVKASLALESMTLHSPIDGVVQESRVTTIGQVLASGSEIMRVVPTDAELEIEAYLSDADRAFVKLGDRADVKVASFPFTRYGTLSASVVRIGRDAIPDPDAAQNAADSSSRQDAIADGRRTQDLVYPVTLRLDSADFVVDGRKVALSPGMSVSAEIRTGRRRILDFIFSPLAEIGSKAMRER